MLIFQGWETFEKYHNQYSYPKKENISELMGLWEPVVFIVTDFQAQILFG